VTDNKEGISTVAHLTGKRIVYDGRFRMVNPALGLSRTIVAPGSYVISKGECPILDAYLGTCVGVALYDRHAGVGGLIHLLLPEPTAIDSPWRPEVYAATGMPLFIHHLRKEGAGKENLEAIVAGGALVVAVSKLDLMLDIGGRTAEIVQRILRQEKIAIRRSEIGGYFSCRLSLNLQTWECDIDPIGVLAPVPGGTCVKKPDIEQLDHVIKTLSPIPQIVLKVLRMISNQTYALGDVAQEVVQDQVLSAKVIGFCNSVFSGMRGQIDSIERALLVVGEKWLLQVVIGAAMEEFLSQTSRGYSLCQGGLYHHASGTAAVARSLAQSTGRTPPDLAYTAGLLHDIGKVVLDQYMDPALPYFYRHIQADDSDLIKAEREVFGVTHPDTGRRLAMHWSFPEILTEAIWHHHQPEQATIGPELSHLVYLADVIMSRFMVGLELERLDTHAFAARLDRIGVSPDQLPLLIDKALCEIQNSPWLSPPF
jgi:putative nucleotidyltransferase with HDIG domain